MDFTNKPDFLFIWMGLLAIGAIPALINYNLTSTPLLHCITAADATIFIFDSEIAANVETIKGGLGTRGIRSFCLIDPSCPGEFADLSWAERISPQVIMLQSTERPPDSLRSGTKLTDIEMLMFTSGTTGLPKAAIISFNKLGSSPVLFSKWAGLKSSDRFYSCMPLYHATALILGAAMIVRVGGTYVLGHKFGTQSFWREVRESRATCIQYVGEMCRYLLSAPPSEHDKDHCVRLAFGNGMRPDVWNRFRERFGIDTIAELYAATGLVSVNSTNCRGQRNTSES
jgi:acyl-CoA synthetase (AMP-forming)/AMP-acid ligase II